MITSNGRLGYRSSGMKSPKSKTKRAQVNRQEHEETSQDGVIEMMFIKTGHRRRQRHIFGKKVLYAA